jgi:hypothetical protein
MYEASRGPLSDASLQREVERILARRADEVRHAVGAGDAAAMDLLVHDVLRALTADTADQDAAYHAYPAAPLPPAHRIEAAIRSHAQTLTQRAQS